MKFHYDCYVCKDCEIDFLMRPKRGRKFCPGCGENLYTEKSRTLWMPRPIAYRRHFSPEEDDIIRTGKQRGYSSKKIAELLEGRTDRSIDTRWARIREEIKS